MSTITAAYSTINLRAKRGLHLHATWTKGPHSHPPASCPFLPFLFPIIVFIVYCDFVSSVSTVKEKRLMSRRLLVPPPCLHHLRLWTGETRTASSFNLPRRVLYSTPAIFPFVARYQAASIRVSISSIACSGHLLPISVISPAMFAESTNCREGKFLSEREENIVVLYHVWCGAKDVHGFLEVHFHPLLRPQSPPFPASGWVVVRVCDIRLASPLLLFDVSLFSAFSP